MPQYEEALGKDLPEDAGSPIKAVGFELSLGVYGLATVIITITLSLLFWYIVGDNSIGFGLQLYPQPFLAILFWGILCCVFLGFCLEMWPFHYLSQPLSGLAALATAIIIEGAIIFIANFIWGSMDPVFSPSREAGMGWVATAMIVLFGFYGYGVLTNAMDHWPWRDLNLHQPYIGILALITGSLITIILYFLLMYPALATWTSPERVLMSLTTAVGWFYSVILCWLTTALILDNWPWSLFPNRASVAIGSFVGNFFGGTLIYFVFIFILKQGLIPLEAQKILGAGITQWPAQLGVCIVSWILLWFLGFQNWPTNYSKYFNIFLRFIIVWGLGFITFYIYTRYLWNSVLHEPAIAESFGGDPLNFMDIINLMVLIFIVYFGGWPLSLKKENS